MSSAAAQPATIEREGVVQVMPRARPMAAPPQAPTPDEPPAAIAPVPPVVAAPEGPVRSPAVEALATIASLLAARLLLLLALLGGFVLAVLAMRSQTYAGLAVLVAYCGLTILPLVYLDLRVRSR